MMVGPDAFLSALKEMYEQTKEKGAVNITMKKGRPVAGAEENCLIRAYCGSGSKKKKVSTTVAAKDRARFQQSFSNIQRAHLDNLQKRTREKKTKTAE